MDAATISPNMPSTAGPSKMKIKIKPKKIKTKIECLRLNARDRYLKQIYDSGGFDVDDGGEFINLTSEDLKEGTEFYTDITRFSEKALRQYNSDNNTDYQYVRFLKALMLIVSGQDYYITFEAKDKASGIPTIFQACVYYKIPFRDDCIEIILCRRKADAKPEDNEKLIVMGL